MADISVVSLQETYDSIVDLDEKIGAASGSATSGKRAITNRLVSAQEDKWKGIVENFVEQATAQELNVAELVGLVKGVTLGIDKAFSTQIDEYLDKAAEEAVESTPDISDDELEQFLVDARQQRKVYEAMRSVLELLEEDVESVPKPKRLSGVQGPRGPKITKTYNYAVNGKARADSSNSLSSVYSTDCKDVEGWTGTKDLKAYLGTTGFDYENPPDNFECTLPNDRVLTMALASTVETFESGNENEE